MFSRVDPIIDPIIIGCVSFWTIVNLLCMSMSSSYYPIKYYIIIWIFGFALSLFIARFITPKWIQYLAALFWFISICCILYLIIFTKGVRGSKRWIFLFNKISYQPSEGLKICFVVLFSNLLVRRLFLLAVLCYAITVVCLTLQPDLGNMALVSVVALILLLTYKVNKAILFSIGSSFVIIIPVVLKSFPYARNRFKTFIRFKTFTKTLGDSSDKTNLNHAYQNLRSIAAIQNGGLYGVGPGKGTVKRLLPDAYSDFIFSVIGEELGIVGCIAVSLSFLLFFLRCLYNVREDDISAESLGIVGIASIVTLQAWVHMASAIWLIPTKGTTLPLISHGGASVIVLHMAIGTLLNLISTSQRKRVLS